MAIDTSTEFALKTYFEGMCSGFDVDNYSDLMAVFQFNLSEFDKMYNSHIIVENGKAEHLQGIHVKPSITINSPVNIWMDISSAKRNGFLAFITKKYTVEGDMKYLSLLSKIFAKQPDIKFKVKIENGFSDYELASKRIWQKPDEVLVINASPRMEEGYTFVYLKPLIEGIIRSGTKVDLVNLYDKSIDINYCKGCFSCWNTNKCIHNDSSIKLVEKIIKAKLVIYAIPLYSAMVPAKLKALMERDFYESYPYFEEAGTVTRHPLKTDTKGYSATLMICGFPEKENFIPLTKAMDLYGIYSKRPNLVNILRPGGEYLASSPVDRGDFIKVNNALVKAGEELVTTGCVNKKTLDSISSQFKTTRKDWHFHANMHMMMEYEK